MSEQQTFVDPINYFEGDRVRITADPLMKSECWVGRTGTVTQGSNRRFTEGVCVRLDRPVGRYTNLWFRHSEVEFEDNRIGLPIVAEPGDYVKTTGSPVSCMGDKTIPWLEVTERVFLDKKMFVSVKCIGCDYFRDVLHVRQVMARPAVMCDQPALPA